MSPGETKLVTPYGNVEGADRIKRVRLLVEIKERAEALAKTASALAVCGMNGVAGIASEIGQDCAYDRRADQDLVSAIENQVKMLRALVGERL